MMTTKTTITRADLLPMEAYARERRSLRQDAVIMKKARRVEVGPYATFYFENYRTMWLQVHEMLFIEKGGEAQIEDELRAYNPLVPQGDELVATVMFEVDEPIRRARELGKLGGVEHHFFVSVGGEMVRGRFEDDTKRTREEDNKASSVHFVHFRFNRAQIARFRDPAVAVIVGIDHPEYSHMAMVAPPVRAALAADFSA